MWDVEDERPGIAAISRDDSALHEPGGPSLLGGAAGAYLQLLREAPIPRVNEAPAKAGPHVCASVRLCSPRFHPVDVQLLADPASCQAGAPVESVEAKPLQPNMRRQPICASHM